MKLAYRMRARYLLIAVALGAVLGIVFSRPRQTEYAFLHGARPMAIRDASVPSSGGLIHGVSTYFTLKMDWQELIARARAEMPNAIESDAMVDDFPAKVLTIPRTENGRTHLFFPPDREVTILPEHLALTEGGQLMAENDPRHEWASVKISEYRQPELLDNAVDWVRDHLDI